MVLSALPWLVPSLSDVPGRFHHLAFWVDTVEDVLRAADVLFTAFFSFVVSLLATIYPSYRAAKINPAEALRYE